MWEDPFGGAVKREDLKLMLEVILRNLSIPVQSNWNSYTLLEGIQNGTATRENSLLCLTKLNIYLYVNIANI